jgi:iron complex outermembrane receptor protein
VETAAPAPAPDANGNADDALKAVVVTAERREESAQKVPNAVSVLGGDDLTNANIGRSAKEVLDYVPNASAVAQQHGRPRWWIRGVGTGQQQLDFSNPVGFYLDDVFISNSTATGFPIFDLDRVEVLRGPQGTLWGKNTTGGAINVISRKPDFNYDGYLKLDYSSYNTKLLEGAFGGPIWTDRIAARASFHYEDHGGRYHNLVTQRREGQFQDGAFRLQLLAKITPNFEALANVHARKYNTSGGTWSVTGTGPDGSYLAGYVPSTSRDQVASNVPAQEEIRQTGAVLNLKASFGKYALTAISGYEEFRNVALADSDYTPLEVSRSYANGRSFQWSEEIRLTSPRQDRLNWIAGVYAIYEKIKRGSASAKLPDVAETAPGLANYNYTYFDHQTKSVAAFASSTLNIIDALSLTAGLRWTLENRELSISRVASAPDAAATFSNISTWWEPSSVSSPLSTTYDVNPEKTWNNFTYDVTPKYQFTKDLLAYFRYAHGIKSGGFNTAATNLAALNVVQPEKLDDLELGVKTAFLGNRLVVNATVFHYFYSDIQVNVVGPLPPTNTAVSYLQNVKRGRVDGAELEVDSLLVRNLHVGGNLGLLDTEFTDFHVLNGGPDYSGNEFVRSPHVTALVRADYRVPLPVASAPSLSVAADWHYLSRQFHFTTNQDNRLLGSDPYSVLNARVTLASNDEKLALMGYVSNLLDSKYRAHTLPAARDATGAPVTWGDPRTFGVSVTGRWY